MKRKGSVMGDGLSQLAQPPVTISSAAKDAVDMFETGWRSLSTVVPEPRTVAYALLESDGTAFVSYVKGSSCIERDSNEPSSRPCSWPVKQQRICRVDVRYPEHVSLEARDFMNKVRFSSFRGH
jgi:hypothetical protein